MTAGWFAQNGLDAAEAIAKSKTMNPRLYTFVGGDRGAWSVTVCKAVTGEPLPAVKRLDILNASVAALPEGAQWMLRGVTSNERYVTRAEKNQLVAKQAALERPEATHAALIPIRKNAKWWALTPDERRAIFEDRSHHTEVGLKYLPAIARRLHHCRDLGENEPFDVLFRRHQQILPSIERQHGAPDFFQLRGIARALAVSGNTDFVVREMPGLNHLFQRCETGVEREYAKIEETMSPEVLQIVGDWILQHVHPAR